MDPDLRALFGAVTPAVSGTVLAAGLFEPNILRWGGIDRLGAFLGVADWVRMRAAVRRRKAPAPTAILVVTTERVYAYDGSLLRLSTGLREVASWDRRQLVATAVPIPLPHPPAWGESGYHPPPALRLECPAGTLVAEMKAVAWDERVERVFEELTGETPARS